MFFRWLLVIHNVFRWVVLLALLWGLFRGYRGWRGKNPWVDTDRRVGMLLTISYDVQFLLGLILALISPVISAAFTNFGTAMQVSDYRFFAVEHMPMMLVALIIAHVTSVLARKAPDDALKHRRAALGYTLVLVITALAIPWFRPLLRF